MTNQLKPAIVGWAHTPFGKFPEKSMESMIVEVVTGVLEQTSVDPEDIDGIWIGNLNGGFVPDIFISSLPLQASSSLRWKPSTRLENACASGSAAIFGALDAIEAGRAKLTLVIGVEKMSEISGPETTRVLSGASYVKEEAAKGMTFPGIFATIAQTYFDRYGNHSATLAKIAAKNHKNGIDNPWAQIKSDLGFDFCNEVSAKNPIIAAPLRKTDCSLVSDGAAAILIASGDYAKAFRHKAFFKARKQINDFLPMSKRDFSSFEGPRRAWKAALNEANLSIHDLSFAEVHDCFTIAELIFYEAMGLAKPGQGYQLLDNGTVFRDGKLPINSSGGLKAKGHPVGATGVSMHVISAMQLTGNAGNLQLPNPSLAGICNMGGAAVANYVSILEAE